MCAPESVHAHAQTYSQAKVKKEEDIEGHIDLQRKVFVEVLAGFYRTGRKKKINIIKMLNIWTDTAENRLFISNEHINGENWETGTTGIY